MKVRLFAQCGIPGCANAVKALGMCGTHYDKRKNGDLTLPERADLDPCTPRGHACDQCARCVAGHCCRNELPNHRLPELGEIQPVFGVLGVFNDHGSEAECHVCGAWARQVAMHAWHAHDLTADEYRAAFGLKRQHPLVCSDTSELKARILREGGDWLAQYREQGAEVLRSITPEQRAENTHRYRNSLELTRERKERGLESRTVHHGTCPICMEEWSGTGPDLAERVTCGKRECFRAYLSIQRGGDKEHACVVCGTTWRGPTWNRRRTCSDACLAVRRAEVGRDRTWAAESRKKLSETAKRRPLVTDPVTGRIVGWKASEGDAVASEGG
jgi:hypothetical protein